MGKTRGRGINTIILLFMIVILCSNSVGAAGNSICTAISCAERTTESTDSWKLGKQPSRYFDFYRTTEDILQRSTRNLTIENEGRKEFTLLRNYGTCFTLSFLTPITLHTGSEAYLKDAVLQTECSASSIHAVIQFIQNKDGCK